MARYIDPKTDVGFKRPLAQEDSMVEMQWKYQTFLRDRVRYIELPKSGKDTGELTAHGNKWIYLLKNTPALQDIPAARALSPGERLCYEASRKSAHDVDAKIMNMHQKERGEGFAEGWPKANASALNRLPVP